VLSFEGHAIYIAIIQSLNKGITIFYKVHSINWKYHRV